MPSPTGSVHSGTNSLKENRNYSAPHLKVLVDQLRPFSNTSEDDDDDEEDTTSSDNQLFSKSCDFGCNNSASNNSNVFTPLISRSLSDHLLQETNRRISVASTKGRLLGCMHLLHPGEKIVRSTSVAVQVPKKILEKDIEKSIRPPKTPRFTTEQKVVVFCLCLVDFTSYLSMSIIAPFFPAEALAKGMREAISGFVFSIYALVIMVFSPIFGKLIPYVGAKYMFFSGAMFAGVCNILFGLLESVNSNLEFTVLCFVVRSFEAVGSAAYTTASCTILIDQFPDDIGTIFGFTETSLGIGMSLGPAIGGALYSVGGFGLPFYTLGVFVVLVVCICWILMRNIKEPELCVNPEVSYKKLLSNPHVIVVCIILIVASQAQGFIDPTLEPHMRQYNLGAGIIGLLFLLLSGAYAITSPIVGWISGKVENKYPLMIVGLALITVSMLLLGPSDFLPIEGSVALSIFSLVLLGISFATAYVPTFESIFIAAINGGLDDDISTYSIVSGLWNSMYSLGEVTGPSLGGVLSDFFTFPQASSVMALCCAIAFCIAIVAWLNPWACFGPFSLVDMDDDDDEKAEKQSMTTSTGSKESTPSVKSNQNYGALQMNSNPPPA